MDTNDTAASTLGMTQQPQPPAPGPGQSPMDMAALLSRLTPEQLQQIIASSTAPQQMGLLERQQQQAGAMASQNHDPRGWFQGLAGGLQNGLSMYASNKSLKAQKALMDSVTKAHGVLGDKVLEEIQAEAGRKAAGLRAVGAGSAPSPAPLLPVTGEPPGMS